MLIMALMSFAAVVARFTRNFAFIFARVVIFMMNVANRFSALHCIAVSLEVGSALASFLAIGVGLT